MFRSGEERNIEKLTEETPKRSLGDEGRSSCGAGTPRTSRPSLHHTAKHRAGAKTHTDLTGDEVRAEMLC